MTEQEWRDVYNRYKKQLGLPCILMFGTHVSTAQHKALDWGDGSCIITINPDVDFKRPEHLILHEFAHHRTITPMLKKFDFEFLRHSHEVEESAFDGNYCCLGWTGGHCAHWAKNLCDMYRETGTALPYATMFDEFALAAGIKCKRFEPEALQFNGDK
jgi:hypothetical protein